MSENKRWQYDENLIVSRMPAFIPIPGAGIPAVATVLADADRGFHRFGKTHFMAVCGITPPEDTSVNQREKQSG